MKRCPSCKAVIKPEALKCPSCGVLVHSVTQNNEILKKDKWSFTGVADALDRKEMDTKVRVNKTPEFAKTIMASGPAEQTSTAKESAKEGGGSRFDKTVAMGALDPRADDLHQTVPLKLGSSTSTKAKISKEDIDPSQSPNLTAPLPLSQGVFTQARISQGRGAPEGSSKLTAPIPLSEGKSTKAKVKRERVPPEEPKIKTAPSESQVLVESKSKKLKATAPLGIDVPQEHLEYKKRKQSTDRDKPGQARFGSSDSVRTGRILAAVASVILIATWFLPNIWIEPPVFPMDLLEVVRGLTLVALVIPPFVGAIVLTLIIAPINQALRASLILILGVCALTIPLLLGEPALPLNGYVALAIVLAATGASVVILTQTSQSLLGYLSLALLPATFLGVAVYGIATGRLPIANISALKDPMNLYAGMTLIAVSAKELFSKSNQLIVTPS